MAVVAVLVAMVFMDKRYTQSVADTTWFQGARRGATCCPTHMLEPEVPWENTEADVSACRVFLPQAKNLGELCVA